MGELGMTKADLADKLGVDHKAARRLMKLDHGSRIENVDAALNALGKRLSVQIDELSG